MKKDTQVYGIDERNDHVIRARDCTEDTSMP